eukprot:3637015-Rhodomonas_salina.2
MRLREKFTKYTLANNNNVPHRITDFCKNLVTVSLISHFLAILRIAEPLNCHSDWQWQGLRGADSVLNCDLQAPCTGSGSMHLVLPTGSTMPIYY